MKSKMITKYCEACSKEFSIDEKSTEECCCVDCSAFNQTYKLYLKKRRIYYEKIWKIFSNKMEGKIRYS